MRESIYYSQYIIDIDDNDDDNNNNNNNNNINLVCIAPVYIRLQRR